MTNTQTKPFPVDRWMYLFILIHFLAWTLAPILIRYNLPLDAIEGTTWGHQLEWGYDKNPYLNGWLTALAIHLDGGSGWMVYVFSQLSVAGALWAVWQLGKEILSPIYALIAVMILEGVQYFNFHAIDFNDNTIELGTWALASYCFYRACKTKSAWAWLLTGLFAGLGMMAKYYTLALLAGMTIFLFSFPENRKQLSTLPPYLGLAIFIALILPHTIWLFSHDFITIRYVFERASSAPSWKNHFFFPTQFVYHQMMTFLPALILFASTFIGKKPRLAQERLNLSAFNRAFLLWIGLGPFLLTLLLSLLFGTNLRAGWGMPLLSLWGLVLIALIQPNMTQRKIITFVSSIFIIMALFVTGYTVSLLYPTTSSSANFPGREIAAAITHEWHDKYHTPLEYVAGSRWVGGNISFYSPDHPAVFIEWNPRRAPWIDSEKMRQKGAVFVWSITDKEFMPIVIRQMYPRLGASKVLEFAWKRGSREIETIKIGVAVLPPQYYMLRKN